MPLSEMKKGQKGKIAYVRTNDWETLKKIMAMGALPGSAGTLLLHFPSPVFQIGESQSAIDKDMAEKIRVWMSAWPVETSSGRGTATRRQPGCSTRPKPRWREMCGRREKARAARSHIPEIKDWGWN